MKTTNTTVLHKHNNHDNNKHEHEHIYSNVLIVYYKLEHIQSKKYRLETDLRRRYFISKYFICSELNIESRTFHFP